MSWCSIWLVMLMWPDRNVCLWDTLVPPVNSLVHGEKLQRVCYLLVSVHLLMNLPPSDSLLLNPPLQLSAVMTLGPRCSPRPPGTSSWLLVERRAGSACWTSPTSTSAKASRPTTHRWKRWPWNQPRTASSADQPRATSGYFWPAHFLFLFQTSVRLKP